MNMSMSICMVEYMYMSAYRHVQYCCDCMLKEYSLMNFIVCFVTGAARGREKRQAVKLI